jgi:hypothetical protein
MICYAVLHFSYADLEWRQFEIALAQMTPTEKRRLLTLVNSSLSTESPRANDPLWGLMADECDLVDQIVESTYAARERDSLRLEESA